MAAFRNAPEDWKSLDWQILRDGGIVLYCRQEHLANDVQWLADRGYDVYRLDCGLWRSEDDIYSDFGRVLRFSEWWGSQWGQNRDALEDCLTDLPVRDSGGVAIVFRRFNAYVDGFGSAPIGDQPNGAESLLGVMARTSRFFLLTGRRFITLVQTDDPKMRFGPLGAISAVWNRQEWLKKNRPTAG